MSRTPRLVDLLNARAVLGRRKGVTLPELSGYLVATYGGGAKRYHNLITRSVTEGFLVKKNRRYYFTSTKTGKPPTFVESRRNRMTFNIKTVKSRVRRTPQNRNPRRVGRTAAMGRTRKSLATRGRGSASGRSAKAKRVRKAKGHVCGSCSCGWLHPCNKEEHKKTSRGKTQERQDDQNENGESEDDLHLGNRYQNVHGGQTESNDFILPEIKIERQDDSPNIRTEFHNNFHFGTNNDRYKYKTETEEDPLPGSSSQNRFQQ